jgi:hypothetical protein
VALVLVLFHDGGAARAPGNGYPAVPLLSTGASIVSKMHRYPTSGARM